MDVLLKQDVDLGFSLILPDATTTAKAEAASKTAKTPPAAVQKKPVSGGRADDTEDDFQKWNALLEIKSDEV